MQNKRNWKEFQKKQEKKRHHKYKFQTFHEQLKDVPPTPKNCNAYLIENYKQDNGPLSYGVSSFTISARVKDKLSSKQVSEEADQINLGFNNTFNEDNKDFEMGSIDMFNALGGTMDFLVENDSFLD